MDWNTVYILTAGMMGGLFSSWIIRTQKEVIPLYKKFNVNDKFIPALKTITEMIIALIMALVMILMIN